MKKKHKGKEQEMGRVGGCLLVQSTSFFCCGRWKKRYAEVDSNETLIVRASDQVTSGVYYTQSLTKLIDAYKSFAGDVDGSFVAVFEDRTLQLRAESILVMEEWLRHLRPKTKHGHIVAQLHQSQTGSGQYMPIKDFIDKNKDFWHSSVSASERSSFFKDSATYIFEILDYHFYKKQVTDSTAAFQAIRQYASQPAPQSLEVNEIGIHIDNDNDNDNDNDIDRDRDKPPSAPAPAPAHT